MNASMRDAILNEVYKDLQQDEEIFFLSADFGAPLLDQLRRDFPQRFLNVGIAEQNLVNVAAGLALEGFRLFTYAIAPFYLRALEQIRNNLCLLSQYRRLNVNMLAVGAGCSYDMAGPTHHCFEDISVLRSLPGIEVVSPSDTVAAAAAYCLTKKEGLRYFRLDSKIIEPLYVQEDFIWPKSGWHLLSNPKEPDCCLLSTGYMSSMTAQIARLLQEQGIAARHIDILQLKYLDEELLKKQLTQLPLFSFEEAYIGKGGLDSILHKLREPGQNLKPYGIPDRFETSHGNRRETLKAYGLCTDKIVEEICKTLAKSKSGTD